jgi:hypothetical protein
MDTFREFLRQYPDASNGCTLDLLEFVLKNNIMEFDHQWFQQIMGVAMGTNVAPVFANIFLAILEVRVKNMSLIDPKLIWPVLFMRFIDDGFGVMQGSKENVFYFVKVINSLVPTITIDKVEIGGHVVFMDLVIFKGLRFLNQGLLDTRLFQKENCIYDYIPLNSDHQPHILKNFVIGELKRYVRCCSQEIHFVKMRLAFFERLRTRGYDRIFLHELILTVSHSQRFSLLFDQVPNDMEEEEERTEQLGHSEDCADCEEGADTTLYPEDNINKNSFDIVFKIKGCFQFMKKDMQSVLKREWDHMIKSALSPTHLDFFNSFLPQIICIQEPNIAQKVIATKVFK